MDIETSLVERYFAAVREHVAVPEAFRLYRLLRGVAPDLVLATPAFNSLVHAATKEQRIFDKDLSTP